MKIETGRSLSACVFQRIIPPPSRSTCPVWTRASTRTVPSRPRSVQWIIFRSCGYPPTAPTPTSCSRVARPGPSCPPPTTSSIATWPRAWSRTDWSSGHPANTTTSTGIKKSQESVGERYSCTPSPRLPSSRIQCHRDRSVFSRTTGGVPSGCMSDVPIPSPPRPPWTSMIVTPIRAPPALAPHSPSTIIASMSAQSTATVITTTNSTSTSTKHLRRRPTPIAI